MLKKLTERKVGLREIAWQAIKMESNLGYSYMDLKSKKSMKKKDRKRKRKKKMRRKKNFLFDFLSNSVEGEK